MTLVCTFSSESVVSYVGSSSKPARAATGLVLCSVVGGCITFCLIGMGLKKSTTIFLTRVFSLNMYKNTLL